MHERLRMIRIEIQRPTPVRPCVVDPAVRGRDLAEKRLEYRGGLGLVRERLGPSPRLLKRPCVGESADLLEFGRRGHAVRRPRWRRD